MEYEERIRALQGSLSGADAALVAVGANLQYLSGFRGERDRALLLFVPATGDPAFVAADHHGEQLSEESWIEGHHATAGSDPGDIARGVGELLPDADRVLLDPNTSAGLTERLRGELPGVEFGLAEDPLWELRLRKDEGEIARLRRAARVADGVSERVRGMDAVGMTEAELAAEIRSLLHAAGGERLSFPVVVSAGENGARPFRRHGDREIRAGDPVVLDFGAFVDGYASDQTRTVVFEGEPPDGFEKAHDAVRAALDAGVSAARPGMGAAELDARVRGVIEERGLSELFVHHTGHGVGADAHEPPAIEPGSEATLEAGMVFSVEPGVYVEGEFGVRVEDLVVLREGGAERLNGSAYGFRPP